MQFSAPGTLWFCLNNHFSSFKDVWFVLWPQFSHGSKKICCFSVCSTFSWWQDGNDDYMWDLKPEVVCFWFELLHMPCTCTEIELTFVCWFCILWPCWTSLLVLGVSLSPSSSQTLAVAKDKSLQLIFSGACSSHMANENSFYLNLLTGSSLSWLSALSVCFCGEPLVALLRPCYSLIWNVPPRPMNSSPRVAWFGSDRTFKRWGLVIGGVLHRGIVGCQCFLFLFVSWPLWGKHLCSTMCNPPWCVLCHRMTRSHRANWSWTEISKIVSQNKPFLFVSWLFEVLLH